MNHTLIKVIVSDFRKVQIDFIFEALESCANVASIISVGEGLKSNAILNSVFDN